MLVVAGIVVVVAWCYSIILLLLSMVRTGTSTSKAVVGWILNDHCHVQNVYSIVGISRTKTLNGSGVLLELMSHSTVNLPL